MKARNEKGKFIKVDTFACMAILPDNGIKTMADNSGVKRKSNLSTDNENPQLDKIYQLIDNINIFESKTYVIFQLRITALCPLFL